MKYPLLKPLLEDRPAETQFVLLICILAITRVAVALFIDLSRETLSTFEILTDFSILTIFTSLLILAYRKLSFKKVHPVFGILIILLLGLNFLQFGGVDSTNCFNYYSGIYVIVMLYSGRKLYVLVTLQLVFLASLIYVAFIKHPIQQFILIHETTSTLEFLFSLATITVFTFYLRRVTASEITNLEIKIKEVHGKVKESKMLNQELIKQSNELKMAQKALEAEVSQRARAIQNQNEAIEKYIHHNTDTLKDPFQHLTNAINAVRGDTQLHTLLKVSNAELTQVITTINIALQSEEKLNRSKLNRGSDEKPY